MRRRILTLDGGGIKGVFAAAFLAKIEESAGINLVDYFDLVVGTSTGGIIALGLGLGYSAKDLLAFYETFGPQIFPRRRFSFFEQLFGPKFDVGPLQDALTKQFAGRLLGESRTRLVIPALALENGEVHVYKTAHHPRLEVDYKVAAVDVALATAAAPTYFQEHLGEQGAALVDGGLWANNPMGLAIVEAIGVLEWDRREIDLMSVGCTTSPLDAMSKQGKRKGLAFYAGRIVDLMLTAQSSSSAGTAAVLIGHENVHRYTTVVDRGRFDLDDSDGTPGLRGLGQDEARKALPRVRETFLGRPAERFVPLRTV